MSSFGEKSSTWNGNSVRSTWTIRRPCAAGCKPPDPSGWSGPAHEAQIATPHIRVRRAARPTPLAREVGDSYLEWPAGFSNPQNSRETIVLRLEGHEFRMRPFGSRPGYSPRYP